MASQTAPLLQRDERYTARSLSQSVLVLVEDERVATAHSRAATGTVLQATASVVNIFVGLGLLSMPYALAMGGWAGLMVQAGVTLLFATCGVLLIRAIEALPAGVPENYPMLGQYAFGSSVGRHVVLALTTLELLGSSTMCLIILEQQVELFLPYDGLFGLSPKDTAIVLCMVAILPLLWIPSIRHFSGLSMIGLACTATVFGTVFALPFLDPTRQYAKPHAGYHVLDVPGLCQAIGLFACSVSGHSTFPAVRATLSNPARFNRVIHYSFTIMFVAYGSIAAVGYWYFGDALQPIVVTNMVKGSVYTGRTLLAGLDVGLLTGVLVGFRAYTVLPAVLVVLQEIVVTVGHRPGGDCCAVRPAVALGIRIGLFVILLLLSYAAYDELAGFISLLGGVCSMCCSVILPCLCYLAMQCARGRQGVAVTVSVMLVLGCAILFTVVVANITRLAT